MKALAIYALEVLACSGVLLGAYAILLDRRVRFRWCRAYLLASSLVAALIPLLRIPVWPGKVIEVAPTVALPAEEWTAEVIEEAAPVVTPEILCLAGYLVGVSLIAGVMLWQVVRIRRLRRGAAITRTDRFTLVRTPQRIASFSFFRSIYIWDQTPAAELQAIVAHEASHIAHRHSAERVAMECMKAALWWNPFVWLTARRLTEAEEFEADSDVLASGYDIEHYMKTIFRQLFGYSPEIANGLRDSLTKKRFKMMTTKTPGRHSLLRLAGTLPAVIGLLCAFSLTTRATEIRIAETEKAPADNVATASDETKKEVSVTVIKDGKPLPGAIVLIAGTNAGTVTDTNGTARISAAPGSELAISFVGCKTEKIRVSDTPGGEAHALTLTSADNQLDAISITPGAKKADALQNARKVSIRIFLMEIKGDVIDGTNPAVGATIQISGTTKGVVTDLNGKAEIEVPEGSVLEIRYPDYQLSSLKIGAQNDYKIVLAPEDGSLVKPGMKIRNENGIRPKPLFIVDGIERTDIDDLQADDVKSMSVLKDQSATALYGPRGKNGVVVVTTKGAAKPVTEEAAFDEKTGAIKKTAVNYDEVEPFIIAEKMPSFQGGDLNTFRTWVQERIQYPAEAAKQNIQGRVVVSFEIKTDGSLADLKVLQSPDKLLSDEACRVIESSPKWTPGEQRGQKVTVKYTLPVDFRTAAAKQATAQAAPAGDEPFLITEVMPLFQGGDLSAFRQWVQMHVRYPAEAMKQNIQGRVVTSFIIEKDGSVSNINVLQSPGKLLSDEASRVIETAPAGAWTPGKQRGQAVRVKLTVPVDFLIQDASGKLPERAEKPKGSLDEVVVVGYMPYEAQQK